MTNLNRVYKIAQTGQIEEPNAVDNIMAQYQPKQEGGFWNGLKNFAGSNLGRMTLGGLTGAAIGGLTGRNVNEALLGGIAGATGAAKGITSRNQYFNNLAEKRQERADRMAEAEKSRQHALTMQANTIQANKDAAELEFEREMEKINEGRFYNEQQKGKDKQIKIDAINGNPYLSDEQKAWQISQLDIPEFNNDAYYGSMLVRDPNNQEALTYFTNKAKLNSIINPEKLSFTDATKGMYNLSKSDNLPAETKNAIAANYGVSTNFIDTPKKYAPGQLGLVQARMDETGEDFATASHNVGIMTPEEKQVLELKKMEREKEFEYQQKRDFELFKSKLPTQAHREVLNEAEARGVPVNVIYQEKYDMAQAELAYKKSQTAKNEADTEGKLTANQFIGDEKRAGINQTLANTDKTRAEIPFIGMTPQMQNYEYILKNPDAANSPVFAKEGNTINVNTGQNPNEFGKQLAKNQANEYNEYQKAGRDADMQLYTLNNMLSAIKNPNVYQGTAGGLVNTFKTALSSAGVDVAGMDDAAIINSGKSQLMGALRKDLMPGAMSDRDIGFLVNMVPGLGKTREQNEAIINMFAKVYQRQAETSKFVTDYVAEHGMWDVHGQRALMKLTNRPIFTDEERAAAMGQPVYRIMLAPNGKKVKVHLSEVDNAIKNGGKIIQ